MEYKEDLITNKDVFCASCGAKNSSESKFCSSCGHELNNKENTDEKDLLTSKPNKGMFGLSKESYLLLAIIIILSIAFYNDFGLVLFPIFIIFLPLFVKRKRESKNKSIFEKKSDVIIALMLIGFLFFLFLGPIGIFLFLILICFTLSGEKGKTFFVFLQKFISIVGVMALILLGTCLLPIFFYN